MTTLVLAAILSALVPQSDAAPPGARIDPPPPAATETAAAERRERLRRVVAVDAANRRIWTGEPISLSLKNADLVEVLRSFARIADVNLIVEPSVQGEVTLELEEVPWDQALWVILKTHGLGAEIDGRIWGVSLGPVVP